MYHEGLMFFFKKEKSVPGSAHWFTVCDIPRKLNFNQHD
jgi:hypothetical protein